MNDGIQRRKVILLVEDNKRLSYINECALKQEGYHVLTALTLAEARALLKANTPDVIILDILLPDGNGVDFCKELRPETLAPILFLTAVGGYEQELAGLRAGGDDYLVKPFDLELLIARVKAFLRRDELVMKKAAPQVVRRGGLVLDIPSGQASLNGSKLMLRQKEYALLLALARDEGRAFSKERLYEIVWGEPDNGDVRVVKIHISRLRSKLAGSGYDIETIRGEGYRLLKVREGER